MRTVFSFLMISLLGMTALSIVTHAQNSSSSNIAPSAIGKVIGPDSKPQPGVPLVVTGPEGKTTAFTDQNGQWSLYNLKPGNYTVKPVAPMASDQKTTADFKIPGKGWFDSSKYTYDVGDMKLGSAWQPY